MCPWLCILSFNPTWGGSRSWYTPGHPSFVFLLLLFIHLRGTVAKAGVLLAVHLLFQSYVSLCTPGHPSFFVVVFVYTPIWDSSKSWCALGCPSFLLYLSGVVAGVFFLFFSSFSYFLRTTQTLPMKHPQKSRC